MDKIGISSNKVNLEYFKTSSSKEMDSNLFKNFIYILFNWIDSFLHQLIDATLGSQQHIK